MRAMILGAGGMLGHDLVAAAPPGIALFLYTRADLDITDKASLTARVAEAQPEVVINAAAYTAVDRAESERELAFRANAEAVGELGRIAARVGARVVHFSTDYVFDGTASQPYKEDSTTNPINTYGESKLAGEAALTHSGADFLIVRTQWLFGAHGRSFARTMWERARAGLKTTVVDDQKGRPTSTIDLARASWTLIRERASGLFHAANDGVATWFDVAEYIFSRLAKSDLLTPCTTATFPTPARRPLYGVLDLHKLETLLATPLPDWRSAVDTFLRRV